MAVVFVEARPKGKPEGSAIEDYVGHLSPELLGAWCREIHRRDRGF